MPKLRISLLVLTLTAFSSAQPSPAGKVASSNPKPMIEPISSCCGLPVGRGISSCGYASAALHFEQATSFWTICGTLAFRSR